VCRETKRFTARDEEVDCNTHLEDAGREEVGRVRGDGVGEHGLLRGGQAPDELDELP
jgi:hypothetical protein